MSLNRARRHARESPAPARCRARHCQCSSPSGLPPYVVPCVPTVIPFAASACREKGAKRKSAADALGDRHDVRHNAKQFIGEKLAGSADTASALRRTSEADHACRKDHAAPAKSEAARYGCRPRLESARPKWRRFADRSRPSPPRCRQREPCRSLEVSGPKPSRYLGLPAAAMSRASGHEMRPAKVMMRNFSGWPPADWYLRAVLMAPSTASAPELVKNT